MRPPSRVRGDAQVEEEEEEVEDDGVAAEIREEVAGGAEGDVARVADGEEHEPDENLGEVRQRTGERHLDFRAGVAVVPDVGEAAERPQEDLVHLPADVPRREAVPELVHEHGAEQHGTVHEEREDALLEGDAQETQDRRHGDVRGEERVKLHGMPNTEPTGKVRSMNDTPDEAEAEPCGGVA